MKRKVKRALSPFQAFVQSESFGGIILLLAAVVAFVWANSSWADSYQALKHFSIRVGFGNQLSLQQSLFHWVNDGLMVLFFLLVGLEIKREVLAGELSNVRTAVLPVVAAIGGMVLPALIFVWFNLGGPGVNGWGIPMATDIAFALGILALVGKSIPFGLRVFLTALAIVDDLGAVLVIAFFYSHGLNWLALGVALFVWLIALAYGLRGGHWLTVYAVLGVIMWFFMLRSGIHATVAGILLALTLPLTASSNHEAGQSENEHRSPLHRLEHGLSPWVAYLIVPVFAFLNAGFSLGDEPSFLNPLILGAFLGLLVGKPAGILGASWLAVKLRMADLPQRTTWLHLGGAATLAGIGFTMSLFVADLAFGEPKLQDYAKLGILTASVASALIGFFLLKTASPPAAADPE